MISPETMVILFIAWLLFGGISAITLGAMKHKKRTQCDNTDIAYGVIVMLVVMLLIII